MASHHISILRTNSCTLEDVEQALTLGLLRVGVQLGGFKKKPVRKGYITCQDMLEVLPYDEHYDHSDHHIDVRNSMFDRSIGAQHTLSPQHTPFLN